jgi:hypothetical protein
MGTHQGDPLGGALFVLAHFKALHSIANFFPFCLFPSIVDDIHIINPPSIVSSTYKHFQTKLHVISLSIQVQKCVAWSPFGLLPTFNTLFQFYTPSKGIRILGVPLGTSSFTSSTIKDALLEDVRHVNLLFKLGDGNLWNYNSLFHAMAIIFLMMHTSLLHFHKVCYFFLFIPPLSVWAPIGFKIF